MASTLRNRVTGLRYISGQDLLANPRNFRQHGKAQTAALEGLLAEVGIAGALVAYETPNGLQLIDGHLRKDTAPHTLWPVLVLDVSEVEANTLLATMDPLAAMAGTDADKLAALLAEVETGSAAVQALLDDLADAAGIVRETSAPGLGGDEFDTTPDAGPPTAQLGDLWALGEHRLLVGDCRDASTVVRLLNGGQINVAVTSPPYAAQRTYDVRSGFTPIQPDTYVEWYQPVAENIKTHLAHDGSYFCNIKEHAENGQRNLYVKDLTISHVRSWGWLFVDEFCWCRPGPPGAWPNRFKNNWEPVFHYATSPGLKFYPRAVAHESDAAVPHASSVGASADASNGTYWHLPKDRKAGMALPGNVIEVHGVEANTGHVAAYPVGLPEFFIKAYSDAGDAIYDPFMGSGTTLIAAERTGRVAYGCELSPAYCDVIIRRFEAETGETAHRIE